MLCKISIGIDIYDINEQVKTNRITFMMRDNNFAALSLKFNGFMFEIIKYMRS